MTKVFNKYLMKFLWIVGIIILAFILFTCIQLQTIQLPESMTGSPEVIDSIQQQDPQHFSFILMGDTKSGTATMENLLEITAQETPAFVVILGDFASKATPYAHRFFAMEAQEYASRIPILVIPGNHDVDTDGPFTLTDFESLYGPANKSFRIDGYLFILLNNLDDYNKDGQYIDFLENTIQSQETVPEHIFVFMHIPPAGLNAPIMAGELIQSERFLETVQKYHVDYVFCGDHHGYVKTKFNGVNFIISGGGGANLRGTQGHFHHAVRIAVNGDEIDETVIAVKRKIETLEMLEQNIANYIWAPFMEHPFLSSGILIVIIYFLFIHSHRQKIVTSLKKTP